MTAGRGFVRENALLLAAVALPLAVVLLFLIASAVPRWMVPPPAYDLLLRREGPYDQTRPRVAVNFTVRDGRMEAVVRPMPGATYSQVPTLLLVEHETMNVREIPFEIPADLKEGDPPVTVPIDVLAGRHVLAQTRAPDGYELRTSEYRRSGLFGELFGMRSRPDRISLVNRGRVVPIPLPDGYGYGVAAVGWVLDEGSR